MKKARTDATAVYTSEDGTVYGTRRRASAGNMITIPRQNGLPGEADRRRKTREK